MYIQSGDVNIVLIVTYFQFVYNIIIVFLRKNGSKMLTLYFLAIPQMFTKFSKNASAFK